MRGTVDVAKQTRRKDFDSSATMFAVPGWSVSSSALKTQTPQQSLAKMQQQSTSNNSESNLVGGSRKKRKRTHSISKSSHVNSANFADLWDIIIEKRTKRRSSKTEKKYEKKYEKRKDAAENHNEAPDRQNNDVPEIEDMISMPEERTNPMPKKFYHIEQLELDDSAPKPNSEPSNPAPPSKSFAQLTPLQASMRLKLISARFRHLNETLYTKPSTSSFELFQQNPEMFQEYHEGFRRQVQVWPENPVNGYVSQIRLRGAHQGQTHRKSKNVTKDVSGDVKLDSEATPLPRSSGICRIADLGCGDAVLSQSLENSKRKLKLQISSYDFQNPNPLVTRADIADLPLVDGSVDVAIFCLALMGTNWIDFIEEAFRVLRWKGELWIAEIKSRFGRVTGKKKIVDHSVGNRKRPSKIEAKRLEEDDTSLLVEVDGHDDSNGETDISAFVEVLSKRGFILHNERSFDLSNRMFVTMNFVKAQTPIKGKCVPVPKGMVEMGLDTWKRKPKGKFLEDAEAPLGSEASVLKPCVYKLR